MDILHTKKFTGTPFIITAEHVPNKPGQWESTKISIYRDENLIGEYIRNYSNYGPMTFFPFSTGDEWYALYSANYTTTRVMKLHDNSVEDWCGEEPKSGGFCPVEFYIPRYNRYSSLMSDNSPESYEYFMVDTEYKDDAEFIKDWKSPEFLDSSYCDFAFLSGCVWGDDVSWKLRYVDLSRIPDKEFLIIEKFGYWELPTNVTLRQCIDMSGWEPNHSWVNLTRMEHFNLVTGERC